MILHQVRFSIAPLALPLILTFSCAGRAPSPAASPPPAASAAPSTAVSFDGETVARLNRMALWLNLLQPESTSPPAFEAHGFPLTADDYEASRDAFLDGRPLTEELEAAFHARLEERALLLRYFEAGGLEDAPSFPPRARDAIRTVLAREILETLLRERPIGPDELRAVYEERKETDYALPARVRVRIIQVETVEEAEELLARLEADEAGFRDLALENSIHESRGDGGELPEFSRGTYAEGFEATVFAMEPGDLRLHTGPSGTFLIDKVTHIAASHVPFDQARPALRRELEEKRREEILRGIREEAGGRE